MVMSKRNITTALKVVFDTKSGEYVYVTPGQRRLLAVWYRLMKGFPRKMSIPVFMAGSGEQSQMVIITKQMLEDSAASLEEDFTMWLKEEAEKEQLQEEKTQKEMKYCFDPTVKFDSVEFVTHQRRIQQLLEERERSATIARRMETT